MFFERTHAPGGHGSALLGKATHSVYAGARSLVDNGKTHISMNDSCGHHSTDKAVSSSSQDWLWSAPDQELTLPMARPRKE